MQHKAYLLKSEGVDRIHGFGGVNVDVQAFRQVQQSSRRAASIAVLHPRALLPYGDTGLLTICWDGQCFRGGPPPRLLQGLEGAKRGSQGLQIAV